MMRSVENVVRRCDRQELRGWVVVLYSRVSACVGLGRARGGTGVTLGEVACASSNGREYVLPRPTPSLTNEAMIGASQVVTPPFLAMTARQCRPPHLEVTAEAAELFSADGVDVPGFRKPSDMPLGPLQSRSGLQPLDSSPFIQHRCRIRMVMTMGPVQNHVPCIAGWRELIGRHRGFTWTNSRKPYQHLTRLTSQMQLSKPKFSYKSIDVQLREY